jgi:hypothetical protein
LSYNCSKPEKKHPLPYRGKTVDLDQVTKDRKKLEYDNAMAAQSKAVSEGLK